ncbi:MAG: glycosyltransferase family 4 protein [Alphaproteobacteria bacterium]|nr:glycosyltransferase family 4 protein [Alphaproteobacteria bacterium]MDP6622326.1 glycosyltransferase family 4 protein [Alphaproteobacteria bacterium]
MRIAFYAPLKAPTHATPSGDRRMARLLTAALEAAGHTVLLASEFRSFDAHGEIARQAEIKAQAEAEAAALVARYRAAPEPPEAWLSYHLYYKAPDWLGPAVCRQLGLPYLVAEASHAPKRANGPWDLGHRAVAAALGQAAVVLSLTTLDMACVAPLLAPEARLLHLPPFLDARPFAEARAGRAASRTRLAAELELDPDGRWLLTVAMMRPGDKFESYRRLAQVLPLLPGNDWTLLVVGDGPVRAEVESLFGAVAPGRVVFAGAREPASLPALFASSDLYLWPAAGEAYGMALLEAQAAGLPVVAGNVRGVPEVVWEGETALLVPENDAEAFAAAVRYFLDDPNRRHVGDIAAHRVARERGLERAGDILDRALAAARPAAA